MNYRLLGKSGLRVSEFCLGTMTFGEDWGWGSSKDEAKKIYDAFRKEGGNFIDTANIYTNGTSESFLGEFLKGTSRERGPRNEIYKRRSGHGPKRSGQSPQEHGAGSRSEFEAASD